MLDPTTSDDLFASGYAITYGIHADAWKCGVADNDCGEDAAGEQLTCRDEMHGASKTDALYLHCVDSTGNPPISTAAQATGASIRIISKELLDGTKLEQFACACHAGTCPSGGEWSIDPENCAACGDDPATTILETGRCLDLNNDRVPDISTLQAGVATITCAGVTGFGTNGVYQTVQGDGYYYPSGNQFSPAATGYLGVGPALVIEPQIGLPTAATCTIAVSSVVTDKDGNSFDPTNGAVTFQTESLVIAGSAPEADDDEAEITDTVEVDFNANIDPDSVDATNFGVRVEGTTVFLPGEIEVDGSAVIITLDADLLPETTYEIIVGDGFTDEYGQPLDEQDPITFTTAAAM